MKKAVMYGAGNIGRGFIGQVFHESGYEVVFIDIRDDMIDALNTRGEYPLHIVTNEGTKVLSIDNVRGVNGKDAEAVANEIATCDIMATSVGAGVLKFIAGNIAEGIKRRFAKADAPALNILICENLMDAGHYLYGLLAEHMEESYFEKVGLVEGSIGRMVPVMTPEMQAGDILCQWAEPFATLPMDKVAFKGGIPELKGLVPYTPFRYYEERKLYIHNMGHAATAYLGMQRGYTYIYEAIADKEVYAAVKAAMTASGKAIARHYNADFAEIAEHIDDLLNRFGNSALKDTVARVGRDPLRKLKPDDRLAGAVARCCSVDESPAPILDCMAAVLDTEKNPDPAAAELKALIERDGLSAFLTGYCALSEENAGYVVSRVGK